MNYERIIVELLSRIQSLEEKVDILMHEQSLKNNSAILEKNELKATKVKTEDIRRYIEIEKESAKNKGESTLILRASDIHRVNHLKNSMPMVCNAMRQCMSENDVVLHETPSGYSSSLQIKYIL